MYVCIMYALYTHVPSVQPLTFVSAVRLMIGPSGSDTQFFSRYAQRR